MSTRYNNSMHWVGLVALSIIGILARTHLHGESFDMTQYLIPWFDYIKEKGIRRALGDNFSNYTPPYTYLLALVTLLPIHKVVAIKLISIVMDLINAFMIYKIVKLKYPAGLIPFWAASIFWCLPTVFLNSAFWGQADSIFTGFLLITLYSFLKNRPLWGMLAFSVSFAFKLQSIFFAPFIAVLFLRPFATPEAIYERKRINIWYFFLIPCVYILLCLPVMLLGRDWLDVMSVYLHQAETYKELSIHAPNLYFFIPNRYYQPVTLVGLIVATIAISIWISFTAKRKTTFSKETLVLMALISLALMPFLLPKMHERYFYPADVFSLILAFFLPELWFVPLAYQIISGLSFIPGLFHIPFMTDTLFQALTYIASIMNTVMIIFLLKKQFLKAQR